MAEQEAPFQTPYTPYPGGSQPAARVGPQEGKSELWGFFWLSILNTVIIATAGIVTWVYVHHLF
jgi:hypothetical protein